MLTHADPCWDPQAEGFCTVYGDAHSATYNASSSSQGTVVLEYTHSSGPHGTRGLASSPYAFGATVTVVCAPDAVNATWETYVFFFFFFLPLIFFFRDTPVFTPTFGLVWGSFTGLVYSSMHMS